MRSQNKAPVLTATLEWPAASLSPLVHAYGALRLQRAGSDPLPVLVAETHRFLLCKGEEAGGG